MRDFTHEELRLILKMHKRWDVATYPPQEVMQIMADAALKSVTSGNAVTAFRGCRILVRTATRSTALTIVANEFRRAWRLKNTVREKIKSGLRSEILFAPVRKPLTRFNKGDRGERSIRPLERNTSHP